LPASLATTLAGASSSCDRAAHRGDDERGVVQLALLGVMSSISESVARRPGEVGGFRLFACKQDCLNPKSPRSCALPLYTGCHHFAILGGGVPAKSRVFSTQILNGLEYKILRFSPDFFANPVGAGWGRRDCADFGGAGGGVGRAGIGPPGRAPARGSRDRRAGFAGRPRSPGLPARIADSVFNASDRPPSPCWASSGIRSTPP
jgi:hypothetical protein